MKMENQTIKISTDVLIEKTILASVLDNGFWHRWIVHGIDKEFIEENKSKMINLKGWTETLAVRASDYLNMAQKCLETGDSLQAEKNYRKAGIYYNLIQWVFPESNEQRTEWYQRCIEQFSIADQVSKDKIFRHTLNINGKKYGGRIRVPNGDIAGIVILIIPIDSTKEELYLYEEDFSKSGFIVISFDGPGQGETLHIHRQKADFDSWESFTNGVIEYANTNFPNLPINLFGTSSGGAWAIEASKHPLVAKTISVSPPTKYQSDIRLPDYFKERMNNMLENFEKGFLPQFENVEKVGSILVFHGGKDLLVNEEELIELFNRFATEKRFITYKDEGHCCNFKLEEIRYRASEWFKGRNIHDI
ncbi:hypothetical protein MTP04_08630 [Lysinibacillus sp. PLM2]|nr:hypothetical protein MTP04_08630 [Lysinibacillus sp. PLM2]